MHTESKKIAIISSLTAALTLATYFTHMWSVTRDLDQFDVIFQRLYFIPMILSCLWFATRGGLLTSSAIVLSLVPHLYMHWEGFDVNDLNRILQLAIYLIVSAILGKVVKMQHMEHNRARESETLAAIGKSMAAIAHDMRTPLVAIGGFTRLVRKNIDENSPDKAKLDIVMTETARLENLLNSVLDFSRPLELKRTSIQIEQTVKECLAVSEHIAEKNGIALDVRLASGLSSISIDETRMKQALINLIVNAIQASPSGGSVVVNVETVRKKLVLEVTDCGCGIPLEKRRDIFSPFFTTKKEGIGLGLPIVKKVVEAHEGTLEIVDNPNGGLTFRIVIPGSGDHGTSA